MIITANDSNFGEVKIVDYWCYIRGAKIPTIIKDQRDFANHALMLDLFCMTGIRGSVICTKYKPYQIALDNYKNIFSSAAYINIICGNTKHVYSSGNTYYKCVDGFNVEIREGVDMVSGVYEYLFCGGDRNAEIEVWHRVGEK